LRDPLRLFSLDWAVPFRADNGEVWRLHAYGVEVVPGFIARLSDEHDACEWVDARTAIARLHYPDNRAAVERLLLHLSAPPRKA
jgi:hypothetical protein